MPTYQFLNTNTQEVLEKVMRISQLDEFKKENPHLQQQITGTPGLSDPVRLGIKQPAQGFKDLLKQIKKNNIRSTINDF
jgi:hypothetical protein